MGNITFNHNSTVFKTSQTQPVNETYNCRVAMWQIPYDKRFLKYDTDNTRWFESNNKNDENEIENVENGLHISLNRYKVYTKILQYDDNSVVETSIYPNGNRVKLNKKPNYIFAEIKDKNGNIVAEKCYNFSDNNGRKTIYKHLVQGNNTFTIVRIFSYDTTKNRSTDVINYGYTSLESKLTDGCVLEKEYYLLNGKEVKAKTTDYVEYSVKDENGKNLTFMAE